MNRPSYWRAMPSRSSHSLVCFQGQGVSTTVCALDAELLPFVLLFGKEPLAGGQERKRDRCFQLNLWFCCCSVAVAADTSPPYNEPARTRGSADAHCLC